MLPPDAWLALVGPPGGLETCLLWSFTFSNVFVNHVTGIWQGPLFSDSKGVSSQQMVRSGLIPDSSVESAL